MTIFHFMFYNGDKHGKYNIIAPLRSIYNQLSLMFEFKAWTISEQIQKAMNLMVRKLKEVHTRSLMNRICKHEVTFFYHTIRNWIILRKPEWSKENILQKTVSKIIGWTMQDKRWGIELRRRTWLQTLKAGHLIKDWCLCRQFTFSFV